MSLRAAAERIAPILAVVLLAAAATPQSATSQAVSADGSRQCIPPAAFGAAGDGHTDDREALQQALDSAARQGVGHVCLGTGTYRIAGSLRIGPGDGFRELTGEGATLLQTLPDAPLLLIDGARNVTVQGLGFRGAPVTDEPTRHTPDAVGIMVSDSADVRLLDNRLAGFAYAAIRWRRSDAIEVRGNRILGDGPQRIPGGSNYQFGIVSYRSGAGYRGVRIVGNRISDTTQGIVLGDDQTDVTIVRNRIGPVHGLHGIHVGAVRHAEIAHNLLSDLFLDGIKINAVASALHPGEDIRINDNSVRRCRGTAVSVVRATGEGRLRRVTVSGNHLSDVARGILAHSVEDLHIDGNRIRNAAARSVVLSDVQVATDGDLGEDPVSDLEPASTVSARPSPDSPSSNQPEPRRKP